MARLKGEEITFIVTRLACFERPAEVQMQLRETFGIEIGLPQILYYDPKSRGTDMAKKWRTLFARARDQFIRETSQIPIAHRSVRLRELQKLYDKDQSRGATTLAAQHLEQAAKETGDYYTNRRVMLPGDPDTLADELARTLGVAKDDLLAAMSGGN
jgi:hypothetical protein